MRSNDSRADIAVCELTIVGQHGASQEEDIVDRIMALIDRLGADGPLRLLSGLTNDELGAVYRSAHALVLPSYHEGYCVPVVEAMWAAFPITYDAGNLPRVSGGLGGLIPTGDVVQLEHALIEFVTKVESRAYRVWRPDVAHISTWRPFGGTIGAAAAAAHLADYSLDSYIDSFLHVLGEIVADRPLGAPEWLVRDRDELVSTVRPGL